jgi:5-methylcytosine-specific restriction endonuclease McrA
MKQSHNDIWQAQRGLCWICEEPMLRWPRNHPLAWSVDHVYPRAAGGSSKTKNKLLAHIDCNVAKGSKQVNHSMPLNKFRQKVFCRLDLVDRRKDRFRSEGESNG